MASTVPKPLCPFMGHRHPQAITPADPVPPGQTLGAMLGLVSPSWWQWELVLLGGVMNLPVSPWELLSGGGQAKVSESLGAGAVPSRTSDPGCV